MRYQQHSPMLFVLSLCIDRGRVTFLLRLRQAWGKVVRSCVCQSNENNADKVSYVKLRGFTIREYWLPNVGRAMTAMLASEQEFTDEESFEVMKAGGCFAALFEKWDISERIYGEFFHAVNQPCTICCMAVHTHLYPEHGKD